jgi:prepilin-type N-terminal cleavage/methylation domain-containing protein
MRTRFRGPGSAGFSLVEMLVVVVLIGLMSLFAFPKVVKVFDQSQVRGARQAVLNKFNTARINARQSSRHTFLIRNGDFLWIERAPRLVSLGGSTRDTIGTVMNLGDVTGEISAAWKVSLAGFTSLSIDPRGLVIAGSPGSSPWKLVLTRNEAKDSVVISGFGRISR